MKTKLPGLVRYDVDYTEERINQLIDYLAELTEVVEGKQSMKELGSVDATGETTFWGKTPTLKEQLLEQVRLMQYTPWDHRNDREGEITVVKLSDVEAIINRLMP